VTCPDAAYLRACRGAPRGAMESSGGERPPPSGRRSGPAEAGGSLIRGTPGRAGSSPVNGGTCRDYQTVRVCLARSEGVTRVNQWLTLRKLCAGSNLMDTGRWAARDFHRYRAMVVNSEAGLRRRWGGHAEGLRRRRGEAAGVELGASLTERSRSERGNHPWSPFPPGHQPGDGQVRCRPTVIGWGGGPVVVRARESRAHGQGGQQASSMEIGTLGGVRR
jgi:hypothetical protein